MQEMITVENIKCGGCAKTIENTLLKNSDVRNVTVDVEQGLVTIEGDNLQREPIVNTLLSLGYPEKGSVAGLQSLKAKSKSFVSCAIGRMDQT